MSSSITVPVWLAAIIALLALWALLDRLLMPSARWFIRSRANRVLDEVSQRLPIHIRPFQQVRRQALIDRLVFDEKVQHAVRAFADAQAMPRAVALAQAQRYAREIVPAFNAYMYFRVGYWIGKKLSQSLYRVRIGYTDDAGLAAIPQDATVVFVMNHRSNMDYIIASYLAAERAALSYAVGEWARVWGLQQLIRAMGAYFVRRNSKDELYRRVLERYIAMATEAGVTQAVYPEGGLTRDGRLREPRFGVLDYMLRGFHTHGERDLVFVPLGLNYDRVLEDRVLTAAASAPAGERPRLGFNPLVFSAWIAKGLWQRVRGTWHRYGYACVSFGRPLSLRSYLAERGTDVRALPEDQRFAEIERLGQRLMNEVGRVVPALPVSLVASALLAGGDHGLSSLELKGAVFALMRRLTAMGAHVHIPRHDQEYAVDVGLRMLLLRHLVVAEAGVYRPNPKETALLAFYANAIAHLLAEPAAFQKRVTP